MLRPARRCGALRSWLTVLELDHVFSWWPIRTRRRGAWKTMGGCWTPDRPTAGRAPEIGVWRGVSSSSSLYGWPTQQRPAPTRCAWTVAPTGSPRARVRAVLGSEARSTQRTARSSGSTTRLVRGSGFTATTSAFRNALGLRARSRRRRDGPAPRPHVRAVKHHRPGELREIRIRGPSAPSLPPFAGPPIVYLQGPHQLELVVVDDGVARPVSNGLLLCS